MLLLILFAGCLTSCVAQTTSFPPNTVGTSPLPFTQPMQVPAVLFTSDSTQSVMAILQTAVRSHLELNETTIAPVLDELYGIIRQLRPDVNFNLTVKNITKV